MIVCIGTRYTVQHRLMCWVIAFIHACRLRIQSLLYQNVYYVCVIERTEEQKIRIPSSDIRVCPNPNTFRFCFAFWYGMTATQSLLHLNGAVNWKKRRGEKGARFTYATELFFLTACIFGLFLINFLCTANVCVCVCRVWCNKIIICQIRMNDGK